MGFKTNSTIMSNSAIVRYDPTSAWDSYTTHTSNSNVSLDFYGTDITAYGTGYAHAYQIFLDERQISDYAQRHFNNSEVADYYRCTTDNPSDGFCVALLELRGLDPTTRHTIKIRSIVTGDEYIQALQWLVQYDTGIDDSASTAHLTNLWPSEGSITYSGSWGTLVGGDKVTHTPGDTSKFTFTGSGIQIFAMAAPGTRLRIELDGDAQEIAPTETRSAEIIAYEYPTLYSRLGLDKSVPHNVTITNIVDASNANPLVNVTFKQMVIWKDGTEPETSQDPSVTHSLIDPTGSSSNGVTGVSTSPTPGTGASSPPSSSNSSVGGGTIAGIAVGCVALLGILVLAWLVLRSRRRRQNAALTTKDTATKENEGVMPPSPTPFSPGMSPRSENPSSMNKTWSMPPVVLDSPSATYTIPSPTLGDTETLHAPPTSHSGIEVAREVMAEQKQARGPLSPSTLRDTDDSSSIEEERVNRVILEVARRMGGIERSGLPPDYADLH